MRYAGSSSIIRVRTKHSRMALLYAGQSHPRLVLLRCVELHHRHGRPVLLALRQRFAVLPIAQLYAINAWIALTIVLRTGYTSIGEINNTKPNPALLRDGGYAPAYTLKDEEQERAGRLSRV